MIKDFSTALYSLRNESFHFHTENRGVGDWNQMLVSDMFAYEAARATKILKDKLYSNNLAMFYQNKDLKGILDRLYASSEPRGSQVPSFQRVFVRKNFSGCLKDLFRLNTSLDNEDRLMWEAGLYYLFKEAYYCMFLQDASTKGLFLQTIREMRGKDDPEEKAAADFKRRVRELEGMRLEEICQAIMTDQNLQNSGNRKVKSTFASDRNPDIYKHYKMLLYRALRESFAKYVEDSEALAFVRSPQKRETPLMAEEFLPDWSAPLYNDIAGELAGSPDLQRWYILGKLLNPRQLNHLAGSLRKCIQYSQDVERRAEETGNPLHKDGLAEPSGLLKKIEVLELCLKTAGTISNEPSDYFDDADAYAEFLRKYLMYDDAGLGERLSASVKLRTFCGEAVESDPGQKIGMFYDEGNMILNRNLVLAKLYGTDRLLSDIVQGVTRADIDDYYQSGKRIKKYIETGKCSTSSEQLDLKHFQEVKNKVEFRNIVEYSELIDELYGQLVNWAYLRERDLMYFQLGFHYMSLHNDEKKPENYRHISTSDGREIEGAILYQIAASYINGLPVYVYDEGKGTYMPETKNAGVSAGAKISRQFTGYTAAELGDENKWTYYTAGLELFENVSEHGDIINLRNDIDHFHFYYEEGHASLIDMYSEVFDRFFTYDMKYQKNVANMLENILLEHMVIFRPSFGTGVKKVGKSQKERASIMLGQESLYSDDFTYKLDDGSKTVKVPAKNEEFLKDLASILCYPQDADPGAVKVRTPGKEKETRDGEKGDTYRKGGHSGKGAAGKQSKEKPHNEEGSGYFPFKDLLKDIKLT